MDEKLMKMVNTLIDKGFYVQFGKPKNCIDTIEVQFINFKINGTQKIFIPNMTMDNISETIERIEMTGKELLGDA